MAASDSEAPHLDFVGADHLAGEEVALALADELVAAGSGPEDAGPRSGDARSEDWRPDGCYARGSVSGADSPEAEELVQALRLCAWRLSVADPDERASLADQLELYAGQAHEILFPVQVAERSEARSIARGGVQTIPPPQVIGPLLVSEPPPVSAQRPSRSGARRAEPRAPLSSGWVSLEELATWDDDETVVRKPKWDASHSTNRVLAGPTSDRPLRPSTPPARMGDSLVGRGLSSGAPDAFGDEAADNWAADIRAAGSDVAGKNLAGSDVAGDDAAGDELAEDLPASLRAASQG